MEHIRPNRDTLFKEKRRKGDMRVKLYHLSDLHIGLKLFNRDLYEDQDYIFDKIVESARQELPDVVIIAGDIYDKAVPSAEAVEVFDRFITKFSDALPDAEIMMISGNHDSAARVNVFRSVLERQKIHMIGMPPQKPEEQMEKVTLRDAYGPVNFYLLPFVKPSMVKAIVGSDENGNNLSYNDTLHKLIKREEVDTRERNVFVSHQFYLPADKNAEDVERMDSEIHTVGNIDSVTADVLAPFDYAALGHIHKPMKVGSEYYRYSGTPLPCSVSEAGQEKGIIVVELGEKGSVSTRVIPLKPMREVRVIKGNLEEVLKEGSDDYVTVILTDTVDLDVMDMQDRLRYTFPHLLEIKRDFIRTADYKMEYHPEAKRSTFELCNDFLKDLDEAEQKLLQTVINRVEGAAE